MPLPTATMHNSDESGTECSYTRLENKLIVEVTADYEPGTGTTGLNFEEKKMMQCNRSQYLHSTASKMKPVHSSISLSTNY